jgi:outer membrane protein assembly factor BamB
MRSVVPSLMGALFIGASGAFAAVGWRGDGTGRYPDAKPVTEWDSGKNVVWATPMPSWGNASPVLINGRVFVCSEPDELVCVDAANGAILWQRRVQLSDTWTDEDRRVSGESLKKSEELKKEYDRLDNEINETWDAKQKDPANQELKIKFKDLRKTQADVLGEIGQLARWAPARTEPSNGYTSATPVSDGRHVWVLMGTGVAACFDMAGDQKWVRFVDKSKHQEGHASSPVLCDGRLLLHVKTLRAHDPLTGEVMWENQAPARAWGTPFPFTLAGKPVILTARGSVVNVMDGALLVDGLGRLEYASPLVDEATAYFIENGGKATRLEMGAGGIVSTNMLWTTSPKKDRYYSSPVLHDGLLYTMNQNNVFSAVDAVAGDVVKEETLDLGKGAAYTSVTLAGGLLFAGNESGKMAVIQPGRDFKVLAVNTLDPFRSTPVFEGNRMYLRTKGFLYCVGR